MLVGGGGGLSAQFWKGFTQGPFHQSLVQIGPVVLEELIKMQKANDRRPVVAIAHLTLWVMMIHFIIITY